MFINWNAYASDQKSSPDSNSERQVFFPHNSERIVLDGTLMYGVNPQAIEAAVDDYAVYIQFNQSFGNVSISLYNQSGILIHSSEVDSSAQQQIVIPFINSTSGTYTLIIENNNGWVEGDFVQD